MKDNTGKTAYLHHAVYLGIVFAVSVIIYIPAFKSGLIWDDDEIIKGAMLFNKKKPYDIFTCYGLYYRPITTLSFAFDYTIWHINAIGYHIHNVVIHALNSMLLYAASFIFFKNWKLFPHNFSGASFFCALLFSLHPIHTESVAWISARTDLLATFFFLFAFIALLLFLHEKKREGLFLISVFFVFSLLSKENAIVFIAIALVYVFIAGASKKDAALVCVSMAATLVVYMFLRKFVWLKDLLKTPGTSGAFLVKNTSPYSAVETLINSTAYYYEKLLLPLNLSIIPEVPTSWAYPVLFILPLILLVFLIIRRNFLAAFWLLWLGLTLMPSLAIAVSQIAAPIGERYLYLPSAGLCFLLVMLLYPPLEHSTGSGSNRPLTGQLALLVVICLTYALLTYNRLSDWSSDFTIWQDAAEKNPRSDITKTNYGIALLRQQKFNEAERQFQDALNLKHLSHEKKSIVLNSLSIIEIERKNYHRAETLLFESINENPHNVGSYNNLGYLYMKLGSQADDFAAKEPLILKAVEVFNESLKYAKEIKEINFNLGLCYLELNDFQRSKAYFDAVIQKDPASDLAQKSINLTVYLEMKKKQLQDRGILPPVHNR
ncbi:MAG: hypothetical protein H7844_06870 [Nitrospirae bacterium YQR-1]